MLRYAAEQTPSKVVFFKRALAKSIVTFILLNFHIQTFLHSIPVSSNGTQIFFKCLLKAKHKHHGLAKQFQDSGITQTNHSTKNQTMVQ